MLLNESKRDDFLLQYVELLNQKGIKTNLSQLKSYLLSKFSAEFGIYALSKGSNYYLNGTTRYYFEGLLTSNKRLNIFYPNVTDKPIREICTRLNALIEILRNSYIDSVGTKFEQPEDFGNLPLDKLLKKYNKKINIELGIVDKKEVEEKLQPKIDQSTKAGKNYTYEIIYDYNQAQRFNEYTKPGAWCITYGQQHFNAYIKRLGIHYVVFMRKGFENIERKIGKGFTKAKPHDEYGNSLICVLQSNKDPKPIYITSRWNHGYGETQGTEADHAYTTEEFLNIIGCDYSVLERCFAQWQENVKKHKKKDDNGFSRDEKAKLKLSMMREFKYLQMMIANGANLKEELIKRKSPNTYLLNSKFQGDPWKKQPLLVGLKDQNTNLTFYTIYDRGQFLVNKVLFTELYYRPITVGEDLSFISSYDLKKIYVYNFKRHFLVNADGNVAFKASPSEWKLKENKDRYLMLGLSTNQYSLLDTVKGDLLKAPNGATIFESIQPIQNSGYKPYLNERTINIIDIPNKGKLYLTYDSSAQITFLFDLNTNQFIKCYDGLQTDKEWNVCTKTTTGSLQGYTLYESGEIFHKKYMLLSDSSGEPLNILGSTEFDYLNIDNNVIEFRPSNVNLSKTQFNDECYYYDTITKEYLKLNGELAFGRPMFTYDSGFIIIGLKNWSECLLYNTITHQFFNVNGEYRFRVSGNAYEVYDNMNTIDAQPLNSERKIHINAKRAASEMQESIKKHFNTFLQKIFG